MSVPENETTHPDECERCSAGRFTWLQCTCLLFCRRVINCNGLRLAS